MPFGNEIQFDLGNIYLRDSNGEALCKVTGIQEFDDTCYMEDSGDKVWGKIDCNREYSITCHYDGAWRAMKRVMFGWAAKGPMRCRVLEKLWRIKRRKRNEDRW